MSTLLTREFVSGLLARGSELDDWLEVRGAGSGPSAFWDYVNLFDPGPEVWRVHRIAFGLDKLDLDKVPLGCKCLACTGKAASDPDCRFQDVPTEAKTIANLDPQLLAMFWDLPYYVYRLAEMKRDAEIQQALVLHYCDDDGKTESERRAEASRASLRGKIRG